MKQKLYLISKIPLFIDPIFLIDFASHGDYGGLQLWMARLGRLWVGVGETCLVM